jgi:ABC-type multidrug transport system ATPase subunit
VNEEVFYNSPSIVMNHLGPAIEPSTTPPNVLIVEGLNFSYSGHPLFTNFSARISAGVTFIQGGDGRGKTTLMRLLAGALPVASGTLQLNGLSHFESPQAYRDRVFWIDPRTEAKDALTPRAYLETIKGKFSAFDAQVLDRLIEGLSLSEHIDKALYMLSTGSKRKVWIAAAITSGAELILIDDPFAALDKPSIRFISQLLQDASKETTRAWVISGYEAPEGVHLAQLINLGD